ncbi:hypothetical protein LQ948_10440 [Jiella sp. MQZ9-1]|uniref:Uncharacterized protein n=1 Tax=Jiella flava TaxID=2816857 RepID=A0A939FZJ6_9HYPH|nr:hypothetical protein [Jiella flava]MBO0662402.1 hypothetical protein [Jiella flava]MCD2471626.1 hypothetical protein [Jiella flava]
MSNQIDLPPLLAAFTAKIRREMEERRRADRILTERLELQAALRRFGAAGPSLVAAAKADDPSRLDPDERRHASHRVAGELRRQIRFRRSGDPRYDLNRHIVVARLSRWLAGDDRWITKANGLQSNPRRVKSQSAAKTGSDTHVVAS